MYNGRITAVNAGTALIRATFDTLATRERKTVTIPVTVTANNTVKVQSLMVSPTLTLQEGTIKNLNVSANYSNGSAIDVTSYATWKSNKTRIVTVNNGLVEALAPGTATITVSYAGNSQTIAVTVTNKDVPTNNFTTERIITDKMKDWTIRFNVDVDPSTLTNNNIYITDGLGKRISTTLMDKQSRSVRIKPNEAYMANQTYTLHVIRNVYSVT